MLSAEGLNVSLHCGATGQPKPRIVWYDYRDSSTDIVILVSRRSVPARALALIICSRISAPTHNSGFQLGDMSPPGDISDFGRELYSIYCHE